MKFKKDFQTFLLNTIKRYLFNFNFTRGKQEKFASNVLQHLFYAAF